MSPAIPEAAKDAGAAALTRRGIQAADPHGDVLYDYDWTPREASEAVLNAAAQFLRAAHPDAIPEGIDLMICECGARWFGGNTKYCPSGHAYRFRTERYVWAAHPEAGSEEAERWRAALDGIRAHGASGVWTGEDCAISATAALDGEQAARAFMAERRAAHPEAGSEEAEHKSVGAAACDVHAKRVGRDLTSNEVMAVMTGVQTAFSRSAPAARCFAPHPADEGARCCLREGHGGPHLAQGETWPAAHPEPDRAPEDDPNAGPHREHGLTDEDYQGQIQ